MSDDHNFFFEGDEPGTESPLPRSGMPPVTGRYIERGKDPEAARLAASQRNARRDEVRPVQSRRTQAFGLAALVALIALSAVIPLLTGGSGSSRPSSGSSNSQNPFEGQSLTEMCAGPFGEVLRSQGSDSATSINSLCDDIDDDGALNNSATDDE